MTASPGREAEEEKRQVLNERKLNAMLGGKSNDDNNDDTWNAEEVTRCGRIAARVIFLAHDRIDIAFATKEATRKMTSPTKDDWNKLTRIGRYLVRYPRVRTNPSKLYLAQVRVGLGAEGREDRHLADPQRTAHAQVLEQDSSRGGSAFSRGGTGAAVKASHEVLGVILWKDVGETTQEHVMGDANAAIGIIRRIGLGKVRHLNTSWLWVQEKEASRELQYHKVQVSDSSADLFTKAPEHDSIVHTEATGREFVFGRDPIALTVNNLSAKLNMEKVAREVEHRFKTRGRKDAWTRMDLHSKTHKATNRRGPNWRDVAYRVTADARSGDIINREEAMNINRDEEHRLIEGRLRDLVTGSRDDHLSAHNKQEDRR